MKKNIIVVFLCGVVFVSCNSITNNQYESKKTFLDGNSFKNNNLAPIYPFTNGNAEKFNELTFDENKIPLLNYKDSLIYYPVQYTQVALFYYGKYYYSKKEEDKQVFLKQANDIKNRLVVKNEFGVWLCGVEISPYEAVPPFASSMAQGFGLGVMLQAYVLTKDKSYLDAANLALNSFEVLIEDGGIKSIWDTYPHYEEYADPNSHVLNGYIFSLAGLYYHYQLTGNEKALKLYDEGIEALTVKLKDYDAGFTTFYSLITKGGQYPYDSANGKKPDHYHELIVRQIITLYLWTENKVFYEYAYKFYQQHLSKILNEIPYKIASIEASSTIAPNTHGVSNLMNNNWTFGNYWSTNKFPTELELDFGKHREDITKVVLYAANDETSLPEKFEIHVFNDGNWSLANTNEDILRTHHTKFQTRHHKTYVVEYDLFGRFEGSKLKIKFLSSKGKKQIALRNINVFFNERDEFNTLIENVKEHSKDFFN